MHPRIMGLETEHGLRYKTEPGASRPIDYQVAHELLPFMRSQARKDSGVFLLNGARLYIDVNSHPEYSTGECSTAIEVVAHDKAGEWLLDDLASEAERGFERDGVPIQIDLYKNNAFNGVPYGCHENYSLVRDDFVRVVAGLAPFLLVRQLLVGAGNVREVGDGAFGYCFSQRAPFLEEAVNGSTTHTRALINTRDEPLADRKRFRRLHVIGGDANMSEATTRFKLCVTDLVVRAIEEGGEDFGDLEVADVQTSVLAVSNDLTGQTKLELASGEECTALELLQRYRQGVGRWVERSGLSTDREVAWTLGLWDRTAAAIATGDYTSIDHDIDWAIKLKYLEIYRERRGLGLDDPLVRQWDLEYHNIRRSRGFYYKLERRGLVSRVVTDADIARATQYGSPTTRAHQRGQWVRWTEKRGQQTDVGWDEVTAVGVGDGGRPIGAQVANHPDQAKTFTLTDPFESTNGTLLDFMVHRRVTMTRSVGRGGRT